MSLGERTRMLGIDHQRADIGTIERGEDYRTEPGTDDATDHGVFGRRRGETATLPAATFPAALHRGGHRVTGEPGCGPRDTERTGDEETAPAGLLQLR